MEQWKLIFKHSRALMGQCWTAENAKFAHELKEMWNLHLTFILHIFYPDQWENRSFIWKLTFFQTENFQQGQDFNQRQKGRSCSSNRTPLYLFMNIKNIILLQMIVSWWWSMEKQNMIDFKRKINWLLCKLGFLIHFNLFLKILRKK